MYKNDEMHVVSQNLGKPMLRTVKRASAICLAILLLSVSGCDVGGHYEGRRMKTRVGKVMVFDIEGLPTKTTQGPKDQQKTTQLAVDGKVFTNELRTALIGFGVDVERGNQYGKPVDMLTSAKWARETNSQAFIVGRIKSSMLIGLCGYEVHASFELYDAATGRQIGGVVDAFSRKDDGQWVPLAFAAAAPLEFARGDKGGSIFESIDKGAAENAKSLAPGVLKQLIRHVSRELGKGLGLVNGL